MIAERKEIETDTKEQRYVVFEIISRRYLANSRAPRPKCNAGLPDVVCFVVSAISTPRS
jgi:hypothetical protein